MGEKIRGALFNALGDINDLEILDMYSGTGALSIEAISRGAAFVQSVDSDQSAVRTIKENVVLLGLTDKITVTRAYSIAWTRRNQNRQFDIILIDPPYDAFEPKELLGLTKLCKKGGTIVLSLPPNTGFLYASSKQELISHKNYGDAELYFYRQL
jgi:16S rRNA (guanine(966)-N(2))-methyltransferase RsmD